MKFASIVFKTLFLISCAYGLNLTYHTAPSGFAIYISYYTTQSNILVFVVMFIMLIREFFHQGKRTQFLTILKSLATVSILVTFLIYHFILAPYINADMTNVAGGYGNFFVHYITPLWFFADYLIFDTKGATRITDPFFYTLFPMYYFVFSNIRAVSGEQYDYGSFISPFPYPFLDYAVLGIYGVSAAILVIALADLFIGFLFIGLDKIMKKPRARYRSHVYGAISQKPSVKLKYRFFKSKASNQTLATQNSAETPQEDPINSLDFLDADRFEK
ncbi:MAG: hypothetical protein A2009_05800 [Tenericutes bacterium GWD2_38_27]|nr:MAG: hypothetical protein A2009_05800 [Tenericutes bacterium GWD2_38_27]OHE40420.1 MAG: hypothetical protein A2102_00385 [Tenericutes bacterium GWF2_38_8]HBG33462.1 hypothetical protein [Acholeplasmataceae bacterium]HCB65988.1 hypothetical protein [Acholeplasmataceae bacterium]